MTLIILIPISGAFLAFLALTLLLGAEQFAAQHANDITSFAEEYTGLVLIILALVAIALFVGFHLYFKKVKGVPISWLKTILNLIPFYLSLALTYTVCIGVLDEYLQQLAEVPLVTILLTVFFLVYMLIKLIIPLAPNLLMLLPVFFKSVFLDKVFPWIYSIVASTVYTVFIYCSPLLSYLS